MILKLSIKNYILIEELYVDFKEGFSALTGETGAGKSIILGALNLISGSRVDHQIVGSKNEKCIVEGEFLISETLADFFDYHDLDFDDHTILRREILVNGKSRAFINDSPVKLDIIKSLSEKLINVHSQNHSHILSNNNLYYDLLDSYAGQVNTTKEYKKYFSNYTKINKEIHFIQDKKIEFLKNLEYNRFLYNEIEQLDLREGEEILLEEKFNCMKNFDKIKSLLDEFNSLSLIQDETINERISKISNTINKIGSLSIDFESFSKRFDNINLEMEDLFTSISNYMNDLSFDQENFEKIQSRLYKINDLEKKHGLSSIKELIDKKNELKVFIDDSSKFDEKINSLNKNLNDLKIKMLELSKTISTKRIASSKMIQSEILIAFEKLALKNSKVIFNLSENVDFNENGINNLQVLFSSNNNSKALNLSKVASGGEKSRILFALKSILAKKVNLPTLVFDEIDSGTSGEIANSIGGMMKVMGKKIQILSITHLAQVASKADHHYKVFKSSINNKVVTNINKLDNSERVEEIALMISGENVTESAINQASELLK